MDGLHERASLLQPLALVVMWPVGEELVDNMDDAGKAEIENLRALISVRCGNKSTIV